MCGKEIACLGLLRRAKQAAGKWESGGGGVVSGGGEGKPQRLQRDEGWRLKTGMTRLEMTPIRAALTLDPLSPLAPHRIFMLLGLSLPFQARG